MNVACSFICRFAVVVGAGLAVQAWALDYPLLTVTTDNGTLESPVRLEELAVSVTAAEGSEPEMVAFVSLGKPTTGTLRKRGAGFVMSSPVMTNFTGTVLIEEGAMCAEGPGAFGPADDTAGPMVISNGATLVIAGHKETMAAYGMNIWNPITVEGSGVNGIGAIYNKTIEVTSRQAIKGGLTLTGDTLIGSVSSYELGDMAKITAPYRLNGHTLTVSGGSGIMINTAVIEPGNVVLTNKSTLRIQSELTLQGDASSSLTVHSGSAMATYNGGSLSAPWSLVLENGAKLSPSGNKSSNQIGTLGRHNWTGPVVLNGQVSYAANDSNGFEGYSFWGPVTGMGGFTITRGYLNLTNGLNDFRGPVVVRATDAKYFAGLGLWATNAWPKANTNPLVLTNASLYFGKAIAYDLPQINWHNIPAYTNSCMFGSPDYFITPGIVKTGDGELPLPSVVTATGRTELVAGTLRLASPAADLPKSLEAGLWESVTRWGDEDPGSDARTAYYSTGAKADTNGVTTAPLLCQITGKPAGTSIRWRGMKGSSGIDQARPSDGRLPWPAFAVGFIWMTRWC
ncbi:MAG: hypothetical protein MJ240_11895 [Kiritimatiellae bacterium]|nr:hypothetical protein [Kiritimatiellia bacterium]